MCGPGVPVGCKSGHKKPLMCGAGWLLHAVLKGLEGFKSVEGLERFKGLPIRSHGMLAARVAIRSH